MHLKQAFYEPLQGRQLPTSQLSYTRLMVATAAPFLANTLLHATWWSWVIKHELDWVYWRILFVYPVLSILLQDVVIGDWIFGTRKPQAWIHHGVNLVLLWMGFAYVAEPMSTAHGLPVSLRDVCVTNLGGKLTQ